VNEARREEVFKAVPKLRKLWQHLTKEKDKDKKRKKADDAAADDSNLASGFLFHTLEQFLKFASAVALPAMAGEAMSDEAAETLKASVAYCELVVTWSTDLITQIASRRFTRLLFEEIGLVVKAKRLALYSNEAHGRYTHPCPDVCFVSILCSFPLALLACLLN